MFTIETNIPAPTLSEGGRRTKYPLRSMKIGDSFHVPNNAAGEAQVRSACSYFKLRNREYNFAIRKDPEGVRVWRVPVLIE